MALLQGPLGPHDLAVQKAYANRVTVQVTTSSTVLLAGVAGFVFYVDQISFACPEGHTYTLEGTDGTVLEGPGVLQTYSASKSGELNGNACAAGSGLKLVLDTSPSVAFGVTLSYWFM